MRDGLKALWWLIAEKIPEIECQSTKHSSMEMEVKKSRWVNDHLHHLHISIYDAQYYIPAFTNKIYLYIFSTHPQIEESFFNGMKIVIRYLYLTLNIILVYLNFISASNHFMEYCAKYENQNWESTQRHIAMV